MTAHLWLVATNPAPIYIAAPTLAKAQEALAALTAPPPPAVAPSPPVTAPARNSYVSAADICRALRISRSTLYRWIDEGHFPKPCAVGPRAVRWPADDLDGYQRQNAA